MFSFFLLAVVGIQSFDGQELFSHFFCWQLLVYKFCVGKSYVLIFPVGSCWYTKFVWVRVTFSFFLLAVVGIQSFCEQELCSHFSCWQLLVYKVFVSKSYVLIFPVGSCWYTKLLWARVMFSFFLLAVVGIQSFCEQELRSHFSCWQLLVYKVFMGKSYILIFPVGSCWCTKFYCQELSFHFFCWQLLVYKVFMGKSYILIFSVRSCWYTKFLWARVTFSFFSVDSYINMINTKKSN